MTKRKKSEASAIVIAKLNADAVHGIEYVTIPKIPELTPQSRFFLLLNQEGEKDYFSPWQRQGRTYTPKSLDFRVKELALPLEGMRTGQILVIVPEESSRTIWVNEIDKYDLLKPCNVCAYVNSAQRNLRRVQGLL